MSVLGLSAAVGQLATANSMHWHKHVMRRENGCAGCP